MTAPPSAQYRQLSLDLSEPINHHDRIHHAAHGAVLYWESAKGENRWTKIMPGDPAQKILSGFSGRKDTYLTVNQFHAWRNVRQLKSLRCCYVDIDGNADLDAALDALQAAKVPAPSFVVFSGRGLHCYWTLEPVPAQALPVWQRIQDTLVAALTTVGSDHKARDCTRLLRLVGSVNGKNGQEVRGLVLSDAVWRLHEMANEVLGARKAEVFDFAAASARKRKPTGRPHTGSIYDWWHLVYRDLIAIADHYWFGGVPDGHRDQILFLMSVALSWFAHPDVLKDEIVHTARTFTPTLTVAEVETQMAAAISRAQTAASGQTVLWRDTQVDPRYRFKAETLREWLGDLIAPELHGHLRALAPADVIKQRKQERDATRWSGKNTGQGYRAGNEEKHATARILKAQGHSIRSIAAELGVSVSTVHGWTK